MANYGFLEPNHVALVVVDSNRFTFLEMVILLMYWRWVVVIVVISLLIPPISDSRSIILFVDRKETGLVRYFGKFRHVWIPNANATLENTCLFGVTIESIRFESQSPRKRIDESWFGCCALKSTFIPPSVELFGIFCFSNDPNQYSRIASAIFKRASQLSRIQELCFSCFRLKLICIPQNVEILPKLCLGSDDNYPNPVELITFKSGSGLPGMEEFCFNLVY
jgi:hypothetical protein